MRGSWWMLPEASFLPSSAFFLSQSRLRRQDTGLKTPLDQLDQQMSELQLGVHRAPAEVPDSDSRPSSGRRPGLREGPPARPAPAPPGDLVCCGEQRWPWAGSLRGRQEAAGRPEKAPSPERSGQKPREAGGGQGCLHPG